MSSTVEKLTQTLKQSLNPAELVVRDMTGTDDHLEVVITCEQFRNLPLMKQHRLVMDAIKTEFDGPLHAIKIKTLIP